MPARWTWRANGLSTPKPPPPSCAPASTPVAARERLTRLLGLWGADTAFTLPERLPDLPAAPIELADIERARADAAPGRAGRGAPGRRGTGRRPGPHAAPRASSMCSNWAMRDKRETRRAEHARLRDLLELPLFDWGGARVRARRSALHAVAAARSPRRRGQCPQRSARGLPRLPRSYDLARHYRDEVIPLRKQISDETLLRYNGMLASPFELLADAREQAGAVNATIEALKDFWLRPRRPQEAPAARSPRRRRPHPARPGTQGTRTMTNRSIIFDQRRRRHWLGASLVSRAGAASLPEAPPIHRAPPPPPWPRRAGAPTTRSSR